MKFFPMMALAAALGGCYAGQPLVLEPQPADLRIGELRNVSEAHTGAVLFVSTSVGVWAKALVFDGQYRQDQLLRPGEDGMPALAVQPVGYFTVGPAGGEPRRVGEKLAGFFSPERRYTLLVVLENAAGGTLDIRTITVRIPDRPLYRRYHYTTLLGQRGVRQVNYVVYLPGASARYVGGNRIQFQLDLNRLVGQALHAARQAGAPRYEVIHQPQAGWDTVIIRP